MLKPWIHQQNKPLQLYDAEILGKWIGKLTFRQWMEAMDWLDT